jgi:hypothetical protein
MLILAANVGWLHYSESFDDGIGLLKAAEFVCPTPHGAIA